MRCKKCFFLPLLAGLLFSCDNIFNIKEYGTVTDELGEEAAAVINPVLEIYNAIPTDNDYRQAYYYARTYQRTETFDNGVLSGTVDYDYEMDPALISVDLDRLIDISLIYMEQNYQVTGLIEIDITWPDEENPFESGLKTFTLTVCQRMRIETGENANIPGYIESRRIIPRDESKSYFII